MTNKPMQTTDQTFEAQVLKADTPVLVDFWAPWCGPCHVIAPSLEQIAEERDGKITIVKLNIDENPATAQKYGVMSIPTLIVFNDGEPVEGTVGAAPYGPLNDWIGSLLEKIETAVAE